jgi:hypothetical protein
VKVTSEEGKVGEKLGYTKIDTRREGFYSGNGCDRHPDCLTCPFPDCKAGYKQMKVERSNGSVKALDRVNDDM